MGAVRRLSASTHEAGHSGVTLWRRIADDFEQEIAAGAWRPGERLPAETAVAARFGVNRHTVRRAFAALAERGLVRAERGSGTFVMRPRLAYPIGPRTRFSDIIATAGFEAGGRLLTHAIEPAGRDVAERLAIAPGSAVIRLHILRSADRTPVCHAMSLVSAARLPDAARVYRTTRSMTRTLAQFGIADYRRQSTRITAALADALDAELLRLAPGRPLLVAESVDVDEAGTPVLTTQARFAADRVALLVEG